MQPDQIILVADKHGKHTGKYIDKETAHTGKGKRHLAISVLLYNDKNQVLLQKRKHKIHSGFWDFTGSTHHLHKDNGKDETSQEATYRCLEREYGVFEKLKLKVIGGISYFAADGKFCENEHDIILLGKYDGKIKPNKEVAFDHKWLNKDEFFEDVKKNPKQYAPWVLLAVKLVKKHLPIN